MHPGERTHMPRPRMRFRYPCAGSRFGANVADQARTVEDEEATIAGEQTPQRANVVENDLGVLSGRQLPTVGQGVAPDAMTSASVGLARLFAPGVCRLRDRRQGDDGALDDARDL